MSKEFLKMQKLAGVITESQYNQKKSLIESQLNEEEKEQSIGDIAEEIAKYLKSNGYESNINGTGPKNAPFELGIQGELLKIVGRANNPEAIKNEMTSLQKWVLDNFDSLTLSSGFKPGHMGGDQHNGAFVVKLDLDKKNSN